MAYCADKLAYSGLSVGEVADLLGFDHPSHFSRLFKKVTGETPSDALVREIREELATEISVDRFVTTVKWDYPAFHLSMRCYLCSVK